MQTELLFDRQKTLAILIGMSAYDPESSLQPIPQAKPAIEKIAGLLKDREIIGLHPSNVHTIVARDGDAQAHMTAKNVYGRIREILKANKKHSSLLIYYIGHGVRSGEKLFLGSFDTMSATDEEEIIRMSAIDSSDIFGLVNHTKIAKVVMVLDCCNSGGAHGFNLKSPDKSKWSYIIASTSEDAPSYYRAGEPYTHFSGHFIDLLEKGLERGDMEIGRVAPVVYSDALVGALQKKAIMLKARPGTGSSHNPSEFAFFYNRKCTVEFVDGCIDEGRFGAAIEFVPFIFGSGPGKPTYSRGNDAVCMKLFKALIENELYIEALDLFIALQKNLSADFTRKYGRMLSDIADEVDKLFQKSQFAEALVFYLLLLQIMPGNVVWDAKKEDCEKKIEMQQKGPLSVAIERFEGNAEAVVAGAEIILHWKVRNASRVELSEGDGPGKLIIEHQQDRIKLVVSRNSFFTLRAFDAKGRSDKRSIAVDVFPTPIFQPVPAPMPIYDAIIKLDFVDNRLPDIDLTVNIPDFFSCLGDMSVILNMYQDNFNIYELYEQIRNGQ